MKIMQQENQLKDNPPLLLKVKDKSGQQGLITDFYDSEAASIILAKGESKSILVITALKADKRSQIYGRPVRNSVAFISADEKDLQKIADRASHNWDAITAEIDRAVNFDDEYGFKVDRQLIEEYIKNILKQDLSDNLSNIQVIYLNIEEEIKKKEGTREYSYDTNQINSDPWDSNFDSINLGKKGRDSVKKGQENDINDIVELLLGKGIEVSLMKDFLSGINNQIRGIDKITNVSAFLQNS